MKMRVADGRAETISPEHAAGFVKSGMWLDYGASTCQPDVFDRALAARVKEFSDVKIRSCFTLKPRAVLEADPNAERVLSVSMHFSGYDRRRHDAGGCVYLPINFGEVPDYYRRFVDPVDIVVIQTCPIDANGFFNLSVSSLYHRALIERARMVIIETNSALPYVYGDSVGIHASEVDYVIEGDNVPPPALPNAPVSDIDRAIARTIASEIEDGACLQIGIGGMPNAVCMLLLESGVRDLGIHSEMMSEGMVELYKAGRITGARKTIDRGKQVYSFALGSRDLYTALDRNPDMRAMPLEYTNLPHMIMQNDNVVAINATTQIDLQGQAASESDGNRHISGTGGQAQFVRGAYASEGGKSFICLSSTYDRHSERRSRIVLNLTPGNIVTTTRSDMMYVVTEYGIVNLKGKSVPERAKALIDLAHPDFREGLERQAYETRLIPRGFTF
ncbi:MAG TPA: acetyl-CoA hydrolase/transferase C-terminal domain-containing protein [Stellaceae bacterium]|nr:acetyl-CoA hydrolase/transferase C-terminal domain-containing protein [Stellaceae bacterium]